MSHAWISRAGKTLLTTTAALLSATALSAGDSGYFVTYSHKIERGQKELMFMNDFTRPSLGNQQEGQANYTSQMLEFEWHVTDQYATELMAESFVDSNGERRFTGFRWENRYRLFDGEVPFNPMVYMEYEHLKRTTRFKMETSGWILPPYEEAGAEDFRDERILETRVVLSQDFGSTNFAFNWINETDLRNGRTDYGYSAGLMHVFGAEGHHGGAHGGHRPSGPKGLFSDFRLAAIGAELFGGLVDDRKLDLRLQRQQHYLGPIVAFHLGKDLMMHLGASYGLSKASDTYLVRFALGYEF